MRYFRAYMFLCLKKVHTKIINTSYYLVITTVLTPIDVGMDFAELYLCDI